MRLSLSKRTRWRSRSTYAEHFVIRRAMTNYMSDITIRREDAALWSIWYHSRVARRPEFPRRLIEVEDGAVILHPAFRDSTRFFSFFSISPSTWATVQLWTEIPIELESRAAMTRRALTGNKKIDGEKTVKEILKLNSGSLAFFVIIMRSISSLEGSSPLFVNGSAIFRDYWQEGAKEKVS